MFAFQHNAELLPGFEDSVILHISLNYLTMYIYATDVTVSFHKLFIKLHTSHIKITAVSVSIVRIIKKMNMYDNYCFLLISGYHIHQPF